MYRHGKARTLSARLNLARLNAMSDDFEDEEAAQRLPEFCADLLRCYAPHLLPSLPALLDAQGAAALCASLEAQHGVPRYSSALHAYHFSGRFFDPLRALYDAHFVPPVPAALPLDNVHKASALLPAPTAEVALTGRLHGAAVEARDAELAAGTARARTLLDALAEAAPAEGPLAALRALRAAGARVRVRRRGGAPDVCGVLAGFDEGMSVLLTAGGEGVLIAGAHVAAVEPL